MSENPGPEDLETPDKTPQGTPGPDTGPGPPPSDKDDRSPEHDRPSNKDDRSPDKHDGAGQVSEAGGSALNTETAEGGADAVPDSHG